MHELGLAMETYRLALERRERDSGLRIVAVRVAVGELAGVEPELLRFAWEAVTEGGPDFGSVLEVEWCPARQVCGSCGAVAGREPGRWVRACPQCGSALRVEGGLEMDLLRVEYEVTDAPSGVKQ